MEELAELRERVAGLTSEAEFTRRLLDAAGQAIIATDVQGKITYWSRSAERLYGWSAPEAVGRDVLDVMVPQIGQGEAAEIMRHLKAGEPWSGEFLVQSRDGTRFLAEVTDAPVLDADGGLIGTIGISEDITERKKAQEEVREARDLSESLIETAQTIVLVLDTEGRIVRFNPFMEEVSGFRLEEAQGKDWFSNFLPKRDQDSIRELFLGAIDDIQTRGNVNSIVTKDGRERKIEWSDKTLKDADGNLRGLLSIGQDVTDRKQAEEALRVSETLNRSLVEHLPHRIFIKDRDSVYVSCNRNYADDQGIVPEQIIGKDDSAFYPAELAEAYRADDRAVMESGQKKEIEERYFVAGQERWARTVKVPYRDEQGEVTGVLGVFEDITAHKKMEQEFVRLERLRALGEISAGVSHNLNNILTSALGPAQLIRRMTDDPAILREADEIIAATSRARDLVHRLHLSTRGIAEDDLQRIQVNEVVVEAVQATRPRWKDEPESRGIDVKVVTQLEDVPTIGGSGSGLHDVIVNLILNAVHAMPDGGTISIHALGAEEGALISVKDTGVGMDEETRRRVFEPFFTTKMDVGSGLGLSTAHAAVTRWGGEMSVESTPGEGTIFSIWLPAWTGLEAEAGGAEDTGAQPVRSAKLLIVEDDRGICDFLRRLLGADHEVDVAADGREAMAGFVPGRYDVALIDLGIPGMAGDRVAREMRRADASLVTVLITGWELQEDDPRASIFDLRIQKPFGDLAEVENVIAQAIQLRDRRTEGEDRDGP